MTFRREIRRTAYLAQEFQVASFRFQVAGGTPNLKRETWNLKLPNARVAYPRLQEKRSSMKQVKAERH
jgi:hypothetical protein